MNREKVISKRRQSAQNFILRRNLTSGLNMSQTQLNKLIATNIRGLDPKNAEKEIMRLNILNKGLGFRLPEKHRIEKLIYAQGRKELTKPSLGISESIQKLGDRLVKQSSKMPFNKRIYQFLVDIAQKQVNSGYRSKAVMIVDTTLNRYNVTNFDDIKRILDMNDEQADTFINKVIVGDNNIIKYIDPHNLEVHSEVIELNKIANIHKLSDDDLKKILLGELPITKEDIKEIVGGLLEAGRKLGQTVKDVEDDAVEVLTTDEKEEFDKKVITTINTEAEKIKETVDDEDVKDSLDNVIDGVKDNIKNKDLANLTQKLVDENTEDLNKEQKEEVKNKLEEIEKKVKPKIEKKLDEKIKGTNEFTKINIEKRLLKTFKEMINNNFTALTKKEGTDFKSVLGADLAKRPKSRSNFAKLLDNIIKETTVMLVKIGPKLEDVDAKLSKTEADLKKEMKSNPPSGIKKKKTIERYYKLFAELNILRKYL